MYIICIYTEIIYYDSTQKYIKLKTKYSMMGIYIYIYIYIYIP